MIQPNPTAPSLINPVRIMHVIVAIPEKLIKTKLDPKLGLWMQVSPAILMKGEGKRGCRELCWWGGGGCNMISQEKGEKKKKKW